MHVCRSIFGILTHVAETQQPCGDELLVKANAQLILRRISINDPELSFAMLTFCSNVSAMLMEVVLQYSRPPARSAKERVWTSFNSLCSSGKFRVEWTKLCTNLDLPLHVFSHGDAVLGNYVGHQLLIKVMQLCEITVVSSPSSTDLSLNDDELSALHYVAGYVVRKVRRSTKGNDVQSVQHRTALESLCTVSAEDNIEESCDTFVKRWISLTNRGGLTIISDSAFEFFVRVERKCRTLLNISSVSVSRQIDINKIAEDLTHMEEICSLSSHLFSNHVEDDYQLNLVEKILRLYLTIRGFSFARGWLEQYKKASRSVVPGSKSLRSRLEPNHN